MRKRVRSQDPGAEPAGGAATLVRGLEILRAFRPGDATLGNQDLIDRTGLPKATVSRLTAVLIDLGYLNYDDSLGRYSIGPATVSLGYGALSSSAVVHLARPLMQSLAERTGAAVALGMLDGSHVVYLASCRSLSPVSLRLDSGSRIPIWRTAMGLALLSDMEQPQLSALLDRMVAAEPEHEARIREVVANMDGELDRMGFISVFGTWYSYINAVGVPFHPTDGSPSIALTCGGIVDILPRDRCLNEIGPALVEMRDSLARLLAGPSGQSPG